MVFLLALWDWLLCMRPLEERNNGHVGLDEAIIVGVEKSYSLWAIRGSLRARRQRGRPPLADTLRRSPLATSTIVNYDSWVTLAVIIRPTWSDSQAGVASLQEDKRDIRPSTIQQQLADCRGRDVSQSTIIQYDCRLLLVLAGRGRSSSRRRSATRMRPIFGVGPSNSNTRFMHRFYLFSQMSRQDLDL